jgi:protein-L-isoaspartate(D-aspartate) O-methyltransferase
VNRPDYEIAREKMVREQVLGRGIKDPRVIQAMLNVPRHIFLDDDAGPQAYSDHAFPIGFSQTMSQPVTVAYLSELLELQGTERVLEIGTGSGYQAAVLSKLAAEVFTIERIAPLAKRARRTLRLMGITNVRVRIADGAYGWGEPIVFERVLLTAAARSVSQSLLDQLSDEGFLIGPVEKEDGLQEIVKITKRGQALGLERLKECSFVPLLGGVDNCDREPGPIRRLPIEG